MRVSKGVIGLQLAWFKEAQELDIDISEDTPRPSEWHAELAMFMANILKVLSAIDSSQRENAFSNEQQQFASALNLARRRKETSSPLPTHVSSRHSSPALHGMLEARYGWHTVPPDILFLILALSRGLGMFTTLLIFLRAPFAAH